MIRSRPPSIVIRLAKIVIDDLTEDDLKALTREDARALATHLDYWSTRLFNHANHQPQPEN